MWIMIAGPYSTGADREVERFEARKRPVFRQVDDIPPA